MNIEDLKQDFPPMPEEVRRRIAQTVAQQVNTPTQKKKHTVRKTAWMILAAALALSGTALAVSGRSGFYALFFGTAPVSAQETESVIVSASDRTIYDAEKDVDISYRLPGYELVAVDEEEADRLLGAYIQDGGESCTVDGYTVTVLGYVQDEADTYRLYYSIENPDGLENIAYYDDNGYTGVGAADADGFRVMTSGSTAYADTTRSTDTTVYVCVPGTVSLWSDGAELTICPAGYPEQDKTTISVTSNDLVPAITAQSGNYTAALSPMGLKVVQTTPYEDDLGFGLYDAVITFADGTEYVVLDKAQNIQNTSYRCAGIDENEQNTSEMVCFNRLIDLAQVVSVTVRGVKDDRATTLEF